jgi:dihydrofolate synthase / folylpolyglutamate synthase
MRYDECLEFVRRLGQELHAGKFSLEPVSALTEALGHPEWRYPAAIVAGTNGKGSTSAMLASILQRAGYRTGLYTSPHLVRINERIRVGGEEISDADFAEVFSEVQQRSRELVVEGKLSQHPTFFEYLTAAGFLYFARAAVDFAVLEVGMGGRLDATNIVTPDVAIITNVALDHQQYLGATHRAIAQEKAGIIKSGRPVISACDHPEAAGVIRRRCQDMGAELVEVSAAGLELSHDDEGRAMFQLPGEGGRPLNVHLALAGDFQVSNALAAVAAARQLAKAGYSIPEHVIEEGLRKTAWAGRLEVLNRQPLVVLDGAHNPAAAREIAAFARQQWSGRTLRLVYGSMRDKAIGEISSILFPLAREIFLTRCDPTTAGRAAEPEMILEQAAPQAAGISIVPNPAQALAQAVQSSQPEDVVLAAGSLFLVGAIKKAVIEGALCLPFAQPATVSRPD